MKEKRGLAHPQITNRSILFLIGIVFISFNLRPSITAVGPLIPSIRSAMEISSTSIGLLTTLPVLSFGIFSIIAPKLGRRYGNETVVFIALLILTIGILLRSLGSIALLFLGTTMLGLGIAICNVLIIGIIKDRLPNNIGVMTGIYTTAMSTMAAVASGLSIPLAHELSLGWEKTLAVWAILAGGTLLIWIPQLRYQVRRQKKTNSSSKNPLWRSSLAWQVTLFMGFQSSIFYCSIAWISEILMSQGLEMQTAGWMLTFMQLMGLPGNFLIPVLAVRLKNQRAIVLIVASLYALGFFGTYMSGNIAVITLCMLAIGLAQGAGISLALTLFGLRTKTSEEATDLSGMAQSGGYLLAAIGPLLMGFLFDLFHTWTPAFILFALLIIGLVSAGLLAGRDRFVHDSSVTYSNERSQ